MPDQSANDHLYDVLVKKELGGKATSISAPKEPGFMRKALEMLTGYPADPNRDMTPMDAIQMMTVGGGALKAGKMGYKKLLNGSSASFNPATKDRYGLDLGQQSRRQFLDRAIGNPQRRLMKDAGGAYTPEELKAMQIDDSFVNAETGQMGMPWEMFKSHPEKLNIASAKRKQSDRLVFLANQEEALGVDPFEDMPTGMRQLFGLGPSQPSEAKRMHNRLYEKLFPNPAEDTTGAGTSILNEFLNDIKQGKRFQRPPEPTLPWMFP